MPIHDWKRVQAGIDHSLHSFWITHLAEVLNQRLLPAGYYALSEQHVGVRVGEILTLHTESMINGLSGPPHEGGLLVADAPPRVARRLSARGDAAYRGLRRTLTVRSTEGHRVVALVEIVSPGNKDRAASVREFADKVIAAVNTRIHVLVVDLFALGPYDPHGMHAAIWASYDSEPYVAPADQPFTLASYEGA